MTSPCPDTCGNDVHEDTESSVIVNLSFDQQSDEVPVSTPHFAMPAGLPLELSELENSLGQPSSANELRMSIFRRFDSNGSGVLEVPEVQQMLIQLWPCLGHAMPKNLDSEAGLVFRQHAARLAAETCDEYSSTGRGSISFTDFAGMILNQPWCALVPVSDRRILALDIISPQSTATGAEPHADWIETSWEELQEPAAEQLPAASAVFLAAIDLVRLVPYFAAAGIHTVPEMVNCRWRWQPNLVSGLKPVEARLLHRELSAIARELWMGAGGLDGQQEDLVVLAASSVWRAQSSSTSHLHVGWLDKWQLKIEAAGQVVLVQC